MEAPKDRNDQLAEDLRALRPTPHPQFAEELDKRVAAGFPRRSRLPRLSFSRLRAVPRRRLLIPAGAAALLAIAVTTAMVATKDDSPQEESGLLSLAAPVDEGESTPATAPPPEAATERAGEASSAVDSGGPLSYDGSGRFSADARLSNRAVERSAQIVLGADPADVAEDSAEVFDVVHAHDGIVMRSSTEQGEAGKAGARFELLIPTAKLSDALAAISEIDEVRSRREATDDITAPTVNVSELLQDSKARIDSLLAQLEGAETESEREAVEAELRQERRHRARLRAELQQLQRRAQLSHVLVQIETSVAEEPSGGGTWGIDDALRDAGKILAIAAAVIAIALAVIGPFALIGLLAWLAHRAWVRRERRRVLT